VVITSELLDRNIDEALHIGDLGLRCRKLPVKKINRRFVSPHPIAPAEQVVNFVGDN
jgi:hypothetical protein